MVKSRTRQGYTNPSLGPEDQLVPSNDLTLRPNVKAHLVRPDHKSALFYRPWLPLNPEHPESLLDPSRFPQAPTELSEFLVRVPVASYVGEEKRRITFICNNPSNKQGHFNNPWSRLFFSAHKAWKTNKFGDGRAWNSEWNPLMVQSGGGAGKKGQNAAITGPQDMYYQVGHVYAGLKNIRPDQRVPYGLGPEDPVPVIRLSQSQGKRLAGLYQRLQPGASGSRMEDYVNQQPAGVYDPASKSVVGGSIHVVWNPTSFSNFKDVGQTTWDGSFRSNTDTQPYELSLWPGLMLNGQAMSPDISPEHTPILFQRLRFWFDDPSVQDIENNPDSQGYLYVPDYEEQAEWIAKAFPSASRLLEFVWSDNPEYLAAARPIMVQQRHIASAGVPEVASGSAMPGVPADYAAARQVVAATAGPVLQAVGPSVVSAVAATAQTPIQLPTAVARPSVASYPQVNTPSVATPQTTSPSPIFVPPQTTMAPSPIVVPPQTTTAPSPIVVPPQTTTAPSPIVAPVKTTVVPSPVTMPQMQAAAVVSPPEDEFNSYITELADEIGDEEANPNDGAGAAVGTAAGVPFVPDAEAAVRATQMAASLAAAQSSPTTSAMVPPPPSQVDGTGAQKRRRR